MASCEAVRRTSSHGVPSANWSEMAPMRPVWMLHESVIADRIGPDQYDVWELIGIGRMCRLWLPRQSPATMGAVAQGDVISPGAGQSPWAKAQSTRSSLPPYVKPFLVLMLCSRSAEQMYPSWSFSPFSLRLHTRAMTKREERVRPSMS